jgi:hypothetical protein
MTKVDPIERLRQKASLKFPDLALGNAITVFQNLEP